MAVVNFAWQNVLLMLFLGKYSVNPVIAGDVSRSPERSEGEAISTFPLPWGERHISAFFFPLSLEGRGLRWGWMLLSSRAKRSNLRQAWNKGSAIFPWQVRIRAVQYTLESSGYLTSIFYMVFCYCLFYYLVEEFRFDKIFLFCYFYVRFHLTN